VRLDAAAAPAPDDHVPSPSTSTHTETMKLRNLPIDNSGNGNGKHVSETIRERQETVVPLIKKHVKDFLSDPKIKPDSVNIIPWLIKYVIDEGSVTDYDTIQYTIADLYKKDEGFKADFERARGISAGGGEV